MEIEAKRGYLICITGPPGSGKSEAADKLSIHLRQRDLQVVHYTTDWVKDRLYPELLDETRWSREWEPDEFTRTYNGLYMLIDEILRYSPVSIVTDGTFRFEAQRARLREIAFQNKRNFGLIKVNVRPEIVLPRLEQRLGRREGAGVTSYYTAKAVYEEPTGEVSYIDNNGDLNNLTVQIGDFVSSLH